MVQYLPSTSNQITVTVQSLQVNTTLTISAFSEVFEGTPFFVQGKLTRNDTGAGVGGQPIKIYSGTTLLGTVNTTADGNYIWSVILATPGIYTLKAEFAGATVAGLSLLPSSGYYTAGLEGNIVPLLAALGVAYLILRKN